MIYTQESVFKMAIEQNKEKLNSITGMHNEEELANLTKIAECYNNSMDIIKRLNLNDFQKEKFLDVASKNLYSDRQLTQIAYGVCNLYKSEFEIQENAEEKLDLLSNPEYSNVRMAQMYIGIVKNLTLDEMKECLEASEDDIVETTKKVYCRHYNKEYIGKERDEEEEIR